MVARLLASRSVFSPTPRILPCRRVAVCRLIVAPILERVLGDHRAGEAEVGGALQFLDPLLYVVQVDHRDAFQPGGIGAAELGKPVVIGTKDGGHQRRIRQPVIEQPLRGVEDFAGHSVEHHVLEMPRGLVPAAMHVFEAPLGGDGLGGLEPCARVGDEADPGEDLVGLDHDLVGAVDPFDPWRAIAKRCVDAGLPQIRRFEHVGV